MMSYYSKLDPEDQKILENYSKRLANISSKLSSNNTSLRSNKASRLPELNSFSSIFLKPDSVQLIPTPQNSSGFTGLEKTVKNRIRLRKSSLPQPSKSFFTREGLNLSHSNLGKEIRSILSLIDKHHIDCHKDLGQVNFSLLRKYFKYN
jgi:hypothetical protein